MEVNGNQNCLVTNIIQNVCFILCSRKEQSHKRHESKQIMTEYIFFGWTNFLNIQYRIT